MEREHLTQSEVHLPFFEGTYDDDEFLDWLLMVERIFESMNVTDVKAYSWAKLCLRKYARCWFHLIQERKWRIGKPFKSWAKLKRLMIKEFLSEHRSKELRVNLLYLSQNSLTVDAYAKEIEMATCVHGLPEYSKTMAARFISGLNTCIIEYIDLRVEWEYESVLQVALLAEKALAYEQLTIVHEAPSQVTPNPTPAQNSATQEISSSAPFHEAAAPANEHEQPMHASEAPVPALVPEIQSQDPVPEHMISSSTPEPFEQDTTHVLKTIHDEHKNVVPHDIAARGSEHIPLYVPHKFETSSFVVPLAHDCAYNRILFHSKDVHGISIVITRAEWNSHGGLFFHVMRILCFICLPYLLANDNVSTLVCFGVFGAWNDVTRVYAYSSLLEAPLDTFFSLFVFVVAMSDECHVVSITCKPVEDNKGDLLVDDIGVIKKHVHGRKDLLLFSLGGWITRILKWPASNSNIQAFVFHMFVIDAGD